MYRSITAGTIPSVGSTDGYKWSYRAFLWLGLVSMLPLNFFITADPYFRSKLHNSSVATNESTSNLELNYENAALLCAAIPHLITTICVTFLFVPFVHKCRIHTSSLGIILCLIVCFTLTFIDVQDWPGVYFGLMMLVVTLLSILGAILMNSFYSIVSSLPNRYVHGNSFDRIEFSPAERAADLLGFVCGQSVGGVFIVLCAIVSIAVASESVVSNRIYFSLGIVIFIFNVIVYRYLEKLPLFQIYSTSFQQISKEDEPLLQSSSSFHDENDEVHDLVRLSRRQRLLIVYQNTKWHFFSVFLTYTVTFSLFPAFLSKIQPASPTIEYQTHWSDRFYTPVLSFLLFHLGDTVGRIIPYKFQYPSISSGRSLIVIAAARSIFLLLFGFCHVSGSRGLPYLFRYDVIYAFLVLIFAVSHGYLYALNMLYAPRRVHIQLNSSVGAFMLLVS